MHVLEGSAPGDSEREVGGQATALGRGQEPELRADGALLRASQPLIPLCIDAAGLAILLGISERSVYRLNDAGRIPAPIDLGSSKRWFVEEILAWLRAGSPRRRQWVAMRGKAS